MKRLGPTILFLLVGLLPAHAAAQFCVEAREEGSVPVRGTVGYTAAFGAFERLSQTYGAASMLERRILPALRSGSDFAFNLDVTSILGAMRLPVCGQNPNEPLGMGAMDLGTGGFGFGAKVGPANLFYAGNSSYRSVRPDNAYSRWGLTFGMPLMGSFVSPLALVWDGYSGEALTWNFDFIAGAELGNDFISASAGYVASQGFYANVTSPLAGIFGSAVLGEDFGSAPVATIGVTDLNWLVGDLRKDIGTTSIYVRRLEYTAAPSASLPQDELGSAKTGAYEFTTAHFEQYAIGGVIDLMASMSLAPESQFYDATFAYHSKGLVPEAQAFSLAGGEGDAGCGVFGSRYYAGVVQLPVLYSHGQEGGLVPRAGFEIGVYGNCVAIFSVGMALNGADIVSVFPYARNAVSFTMKVGSIPGTGSGATTTE